jgi:hypothetical protein
MPQISLTDFVDISTKSGRPKATKVRQVKERPEYEPAFDFYKPLRDHLVETHRSGGSKADVSNVLAELTDPKKVRNYPDLVKGYKKWWGNKSIAWFNPPRSVYSSSGIEIIVNPELGLVVGGSRQVAKLYFKDDALTAYKTELIIDLMEQSLRPQVGAQDSFAVLDVRKAKIFANGPHAPAAISIVNAELAYIAALWSQ